MQAAHRRTPKHYNDTYDEQVSVCDACDRVSCRMVGLSADALRSEQ